MCIAKLMQWLHINVSGLRNRLGMKRGIPVGCCRLSEDVVSKCLCHPLVDVFRWRFRYWFILLTERESSSRIMKKRELVQRRKARRDFIHKSATRYTSV